jgi:PAS domain S-box-containing protein
MQRGGAERTQADAIVDTLLAIVPFGLGFVDREFRYVRVNRALADINRRPIEDTIGRTVREVLPDYADRIEALLRRVLEQGEAVRDVTWRDTRSGGDRHFLASYAPVRDASGVPVLVAGIFVDITELRHAEEAAEEARAFERHLIGIASHDLKSPLAAIHLTAETLERRGGLDERQLAGVERIAHAASRAMRLVSNLLDFTQARLGGGIPIAPAPLELGAVARAAADEAQQPYPDRPLRVVVRGDDRGSWDPERLAQVVTNLVGNAMKYGVPGTPVEIEVDGEAADAVSLRVTNAAEPIPPEVVATLFDPLRRAAKAERGGRSVGLGLYIVREIARAHGGRVEVRSDRAGTTFGVVLPRTPPPRDQGAGAGAG